MTVLNLGLVAAGWFVAGLLWWWVLGRVGFRFEIRGRRTPPVRAVSEVLRDRATRLEHEIARRRAKHATLN